MDKLFTPNRWLVLFCAVFIAIVATLQFVINSRLQATARNFGDDIFTWVWLDKNICAKAYMTDAKILHRSENDAVVQVSGEQSLGAFDGSKPCTLQTCTSPCKATLTFYRYGNNWELGKVELQ